MTNLLGANLLRLKKSFLFWGTMALSLGFGGFMSVNRFLEHQAYGYAVSMDSVFFGWAVVIGLVMAIFIPLFFGTEYSDGTIRNKIVAGHRRLHVYFANLAVSFFAAVCFNAAYMLSSALAGLPLIGWLSVDLITALLHVLGGLVTTAAFCAIYTLTVMLFHRKASAAVLSMLTVMLLFGAALVVDGRLQAPPEIVDYSISANGEIKDQMEPNPRYLQGAERELYEFVYDLLPAGQSIQYGNLAASHPARMILCALGIQAGFTAAGVCLFCKKDLN